ncbi:enoyl-CoA hydratase-related protein [Chachezhania sediminis]|uniref:enoyl-CoA hydratase-related protein n=1 Tax=Chachezhania sediminis TaxID=2599291 RepID=UPI00131B329A|nr:enoyl-CoA hydratase-related protein [Chachezhania sediminis]
MDILLREDRDGVAILTLNRPEGLNALSGSLARALQAAVEDCIAGGTVRCILLTGAGRGFCSGADLGEKLEPEAGKTLLETWYHPMVLALRHCPIPIVAAVNGVAAGAGMSLALLADIILCSENASFLQAFARIGLVPDCGSSWLIARRIGEARARELTLLAEKLDAEKALDWGLVNRLCPAEKLMDEALVVARRLANGPVNALSRIRALHESAAALNFEDQLAEEDRLQRECSGGAEVREGRAAFLEKRAAKFTGIPRTT